MGQCLFLTRRKLIRHLTAISDLDSPAIFSLLERTSFFSSLQNKPHEIPTPLKNLLVANLFFENSTRTKFSFEVAQKRLGAHVLNFTPENSSLSKGESLYDTVKTFEAFGIDIMVMRHSDDHFIENLKGKVNFSLVNAGAGKNEHPSQSLLDLFTIWEHFKSFENLKVCICGDIKSSRVAKSNIRAFEKLGVKVLLAGPSEFMLSQEELPSHCEVMGFDQAVEEADVMMMLRIQNERHEALELDMENYHEKFGLHMKRAKKLKADAIIMHPAPVNRGVEISDEVIELEKSKIFRQMQNGVFARMAILEWLVAGR